MPPQAQPSQGDGSGAIWLSALAIVTAVIIWIFFKSYIVFTIVKLKAWESYLFTPFTSDFLGLQAQASQLTLSDAQGYTLTDLANVCTGVGNYFRYLSALVLGGLAVWLYFGTSSLKYRNTYSMQRMIDDEQKDWPMITPVVKLDLGKVPLDQSPWGMSLTPMLFAKKYKLLEVEAIAPDENKLSSDIRLNAKLKKTKAKQLYFMQLGAYWRGPQALPVHARALFAMFAAKNAGDKDTVSRLNRQIAASAVNPDSPLNFAGIDELLAKYQDTKAVKKVCAKHAFNYTVMAAMLEFARQDGVYATSDFLWLKPIDRRLWYTLNTVGRATAFAEVAGIYAHYTAEKLFGRKIYTPMVDPAVSALEVALSEVIYREDEE